MRNSDRAVPSWTCSLVASHAAAVLAVSQEAEQTLREPSAHQPQAGLVLHLQGGKRS